MNTNTNTNNEPEVGTKVAYVLPGTVGYPEHRVMVRTFKFDPIHRRNHWVTTEVREYRLLRNAEAFASRFTRGDV